MPPQFSVSTEGPDGSTRVIAVRGALDVASAHEFTRLMLDAADSDHAGIVVDLSETTYIDSSIAAALIGGSRERDKRPRLVLVCNRRVAMLLGLMGLSELFEIAPTRAEALAKLGQGGPAD